MYPKKKDIESWFAVGGKYYGNYALADIFHALFDGYISVGITRPEKYYDDFVTKPSEIFADLGSISVFNSADEELLRELLSAFRRIVGDE